LTKNERGYNPILPKGNAMNEEKLIVVVVTVLGLSFFAIIGIPLSIEKWQEGETRQAEIQLEIAKLQASGNIMEKE
jgi:hypothetical protein